MLIIMVIFSVALLLFLFYQSHKLLKNTQKQAIQERHNLKSQNQKRHPQLDAEWKKIDQMKKMHQKKDSSQNGSKS